MAIAYLQDSFGNLTGIEVGGILLASYEYAAKNGNLLDRPTASGTRCPLRMTTWAGWWNPPIQRAGAALYLYRDGQVYSITDNNGTGSTGDDLVYRYTYDTLGRVIHCQAKGGFRYSWKPTGNMTSTAG